MALRSPRALACALLCLPASIAWHGSGVRPRLPSTSLASAPLALRPALHTRAAPARLAAAAAVPEPEPQRSGWRARLPPANELRKIVPLAIMFFCILFNYTILRDTKDVLVVTAPRPLSLVSTLALEPRLSLPLSTRRPRPAPPYSPPRAGARLLCRGDPFPQDVGQPAGRRHAHTTAQPRGVEIMTAHWPPDTQHGVPGKASKHRITS